MASEPTNIGKYEILGLLGTGGMGQVYRGRDPALGRLVAIKVMTAALSSNAEVSARFYREAQAIANLQHPNIVSVFDLGEWEGNPYFVMEFLEGQSLDRMIRHGMPLPTIDKIQIIIQVLNGLQYAHSRGVVHRDVKPANVIVLANGGVKIVDFGIAQVMLQAAGTLTRTGEVMGTVAYMSPEQVEARKGLDGRTDLFSCGVVLFELLTGHRPFEDDNPIAVALKIMKEPAAALGKFLAAPPELEAVMTRALAKDREQRYQTAEDFALDLAQVQRQLKQATVPKNLEAAQELVARGEFAQAKEVLSDLIRTGIAESEARSLLEQVQQRLYEQQRRQRVDALGNSCRSSFHSGNFAEALRFVDEAINLDEHNDELKLLRDQIVGAQQAAEVPPSGPTAEPGSAAPGPARESVTPPRPAAAPEATVYPPPVPPAGADFGMTTLGDAVSPATLIRDRGAASEPPAPRGDFTRLFGAGPSPTPHLFPPVKLTFTAGDRVGRSVQISSVPFKIGRKPELDLPLSDAGVSREHAVIDWQGGEFVLRDLGSGNGTFLNGRRVRDTEILPLGALIRLGHDTVLSFSSDETSELPDCSGQTLGNRYTLVRLLRSGMKTALYEASDLRLPPLHVAIKILSPAVARYPGFVQHLQREAAIAARLQHPHICRILDCGQASINVFGTGESIRYLSMQLMQGGSLSEVLSRDQAPTLEQAIRWFDQLTDALAYAHGEGVVHSGLKPSSIVFDNQGNAYVTDFAVASYSQEEGQRAFLASPDFLAPEQWDRKSPSPATDQYSLAVIAYLALTGILPFAGQADPKVRRQNFDRGLYDAHIAAQHNHRAEIPENVSQVLKQALAEDPDARYPSIREFFSALKSAMLHPKGRRPGRARVFLSYRRGEASSGWATHFESDLKLRHGLEVFIDTQQVDSARRFPERLRRKIEDCDVFVCLLAADTLESKWVQEEIRLAYENKKLMIPVFQESFVHPPPEQPLLPHIEELLNFEAVHLFDRRNVLIAATVDDLAKRIQESVQDQHSEGAGARPE